VGWEVMWARFEGLRMMARRVGIEEVGIEEGVAWRRTRLGWEGRVAVQWWVKSLEVWEAITAVSFDRMGKTGRGLF
jgi:hypothetical protein